MLLVATSKLDSIAQFFTVLLIFIFVLGATWLTTRYIAGFQKGQMRGNNFEMIDSFRITQNKFIQIVRIGKRYFAIAVCKDTVTMLTELDADEVTDPQRSQPFEQISFEKILAKAKSIKHTTTEKAEDSNEKNE